MKLLYITNGINGAGGLERVLSIKASLLADQLDYEVHIVVLNNQNSNTFFPFSAKIVHHSIDVIGNPIKYYYNYIKKVRKLIAQLQPDVISVCDDGLKGLFVPYFIPKKCPIVYERHASKNITLKSNTQNSKSKTLSKIMNFGAKKYDAFVLLSNSNRAEWNLKNIKIIPNPSSIMPSITAQLVNKKVIAVGNHSYNKGFDRLLQAWQQISAQHSDWQLHIFGKSNPELDLNQLANELEIQDSVFFKPPTKNIEQEYLNASIFALPSRSEGFGMVLIEAMACGVPCVSFDCPSGPRAIISNEVDGFLVKNHDIDAFADKIIQLMHDGDLRKKMGEKAKQNVAKYSPEIILKQWDNLFNEMVK